MPSKQTPKRPRVVYPLAMTKPLYSSVGKLAERTGMSRQAVMHMSLERGLEVLATQLNTSPQTAKA